MVGDLTAEAYEQRYRPGAQAGDPAAMSSLAWALMQQGNNAEAEDWYRRAARAGNHLGMTGLGYVLARKPGDDDALREAVGWWRLAAIAGEVQAMRYLSNTTIGDPMEAERWGFFADAAGRDTTNVVVPEDVAAAATGLGPLKSVIGREKPERNRGFLIGGVVVAVILEGLGLALLLADYEATGRVSSSAAECLWRW